MRKVLVFSGAGVSAESGVKTFRGGDGLWDNFKIEDVATISGWRKNKKLVIDFYNIRRKEMVNALPNDGHKIISELENHFEVLVVTQNVDDLHEKSGSSNIIHLHGELSKLRSSVNPIIKKPFDSDLILGDKCPKGSQWRPDVVWFGEDLDGDLLSTTESFAKDCDVCIVIGTSMSVYPANGIPFWTKDTCIIYYVDPNDVNFQIPKNRRGFFYHIQKGGSEGMIEVKNDLIDIFL